MPNRSLVALARTPASVRIAHVVATITLWFIAGNTLVRATGLGFSDGYFELYPFARIALLGLGLAATYPALVETVWLLVVLRVLPAVTARHHEESVWVIRVVTLVPGSSVVVETADPKALVMPFPSGHFTNPWGFTWVFRVVIADGEAPLRRHIPAKEFDWQTR